MAEIIYREESHKIIGACFEVYKNKGCGFAEAVYQECLALEFGLQGIPFVVQPAFQQGLLGRLVNYRFGGYGEITTFIQNKIA